MATQATNQVALTVGRNIRAAREAADLSQNDLARQIGGKLTSRDISRWENGRVEPSNKYRFDLADILFDGSVAEMYAEPDEIKAAA